MGNENLQKLTTIEKKKCVIAKEKVPNGKFEEMDIAEMTIQKNSYDDIISNCSLFHIPSIVKN